MNQGSGLGKSKVYPRNDLQLISINKDSVKRQYYRKAREPDLLSLLESEQRTDDTLFPSYTARRTTPPQYKDTEDTDPDNLLHCPECGAKWGGNCPLHGFLHFVTDVPVPRHSGNTLRADLTTPYVVNIRSLPTGETGVTARMPIPIRTRFGPYEGQIVSLEEASEYAWLIRRDGKPDHCIDGQEPGLSNWMRYVQNASHKGNENLLAYQHHGKLYYMTLRNIFPGEELLVWCGSRYKQPCDEVVVDAQEILRSLKVEVRDDTAKDDRGSGSIHNPREYSTGSDTMYIKREVKDTHYEVHDRSKGEMVSERRNTSNNDIRGVTHTVKMEVDEDSYHEGVKESSQDRTSGVSENVILDIEEARKKIKLEVGEVFESKTPFIKEELEMEVAAQNGLRDEINGSAAEVVDDLDNLSERDLVDLDRADFTEADSGNETVASEESPSTNGYNAGCSNLPTAEAGAIAAVDDPEGDETESTINRVLSQAPSEAQPRKKTLSCSDCTKFFGSNFALDRHVQLHHQSKLLEIGIAMEDPVRDMAESSAENGSSQASSEATSKSRIVSCCDCKRFFEGNIALERHIQIHHRSKPLETGDPIGEKTESFADRSSSQSQSKAKPKSRIVSCCHCKRFFEGNIALERHIQTHHRSKPRETGTAMEDSIGEKTEYSVDESPSTMRFEAQPKTKVASCSDCKKFFEGHVALDRHIQMCYPVEDLETVTTVEVTRATIESSVDEISSQRSSEAQPIEKALSCRDCLKSFASNFALGRHLKNHHGGKPFYCGICKVAFTCKSDLFQHRHKDKRFGCHERSNQLFEGKCRNFTSHGKVAPFFCSQRDCFLRFTTRRGYQNHVLKHKIQIAVKCPKCLKELGSQANLNAHLKRTVCSYLPYICSKCRTAFVRHARMKDHSCVTSSEVNENVAALGRSENQQSKRPYQCYECNLHYYSRREIQKHFRVSHKPQSSVFCGYCKKRYSTSHVLKKHIRRVHSEEKSYICNTCDKEFFASADLQRHLIIHSEEKTYTCVICVRYFQSKMELSNHLKVHQNELKCRLCNRQYSSYVALQQHLRLKHRGAKLFEYPECKEKFPCHSESKEHLEFHVREKLLAEQAADLPICITESKKTSTLLEDIEPEFVKRNNFLCTICERAYSDEQTLFNHVCTLLSQEERFKCNECNKECNTSLDLERHYSCHKETRPYLCVECNSDFSRQSLLNNHQCIDMNERPYACSECDRRFWRNAAYESHLHSHLVEKPHVCSECAESFSHPEQLEAHIDTHGKNTTFTCFECDPRLYEKYRLNRSFSTECYEVDANLTCIQCNKAFSYDSLSEQASHDHRPFEFVSCEPD